jgi:hypothetical protein
MPSGKRGSRLSPVGTGHVAVWGRELAHRVARARAAGEVVDLALERGRREALGEGHGREARERRLARLEELDRPHHDALGEERGCER